MLKRGAHLIFKPSPIALFKAIKNEAELSGFKAAHIRDGVAMVKFLSWLEGALGKTEVTEISAAEKLAEFQALDPLFRGQGFETISSYGRHGAIVHYASTPETDIPLKREGIYLIDAGGQYQDATTDVTRTISLGEPTEEQKENFTRILKGVIGLTLTSFPQGTSGKQLDSIARLALWDKGLNFGHGVGHGVGSYLNVHEGPQAISYYRCIGVGLEPGMITTIEPGYYKENEYGMRIENIAVVVKDEEKSSAGLTFYKFETLTLCPIDTRLVIKELLTQAEVKWLNDYHCRVREKLTPYLNELEAGWLFKATTFL
jgi:Xaa-Pro aminopeptidase